MYDEVFEGKRKIGRHKLRYKDMLKRTLTNANLNPDTWEEQAKDRDKWISAVYVSKRAVDDRRLAQYDEGI